MLDSSKRAILRYITVDGLTGKALHASGVQLDLKHNILGFLLNAEAAFDSYGEDLTGENNLVLWDLEKHTPKLIIDLSKYANKRHRGFQDLEFDDQGNVFVISTYGGNMLRVDVEARTAEKWWESELNVSVAKPRPGLTGLAKYGRDTLITTDEREKGLFLYSMKKEDKKGENSIDRQRVVLSGSSITANLSSNMDSVYFPPMFEQSCLLVSNFMEGTIVVTSDQHWTSGVIRGLIPNKYKSASPQGYTVSTVQIASRIFAVIEWFSDGRRVNNTVLPGGRSEFPMVDITDEVKDLCGDGKREGYGATSTEA